MTDQTPETKGRGLRNPKGSQLMRVDSAGRLKLPARYFDCIRELADLTVFATQFGGVAKIFLSGAWERQLAKLDAKPAVRDRIARLAEADGADVEVDEKGRVTFPQKLREALPLADQNVWLLMDEDVITV